MTVLHIGCCGFGMARTRYFARFRAVEVQETFYQPPRPGTLARWRAEAPEDFRFTMKAWQLVTHPARSPTWRRLRERPEHPEEAGFFRPTGTVMAAWERSRAAAGELDARVVLFQCPASFRPEPENIANLRRFFAQAARDGRRFAWEPRGAWPAETVAQLCRELDLVHCVNPLVAETVTEGFAYFRLHGVTGYGYRHSDADLARLLEICRGFEEAWVLFNNVAMVEDAERFRAFAGEG